MPGTRSGAEFRGKVQASRGRVRSQSADSSDESDHDCMAQSSQSKAHGDAARASEVDCLTSLIEGEVIPRLLMLHRQEPVSETVQDMVPKATFRKQPLAPKEIGPRSNRGAERHVITPQPELTDVHIAELTALLMDEAYSAASLYVGSLRQKGHLPERLMIHLLAPVARALGDLWTRDEADFVEVTLGVSHLQRLFVELRGPEPEEALGTTSALLSVVPGEQHTFGFQLAADGFRRAGVRVYTLLPRDLDELSAAVGARSYDIVGFSVGSETLISTAASAIEVARSASLRRNMRVLVGGPIVTLRDDVKEILNADFVASDVADAIAYVLTPDGRDI